MLTHKLIRFPGIIAGDFMLIVSTTVEEGVRWWEKRIGSELSGTGKNSHGMALYYNGTHLAIVLEEGADIFVLSHECVHLAAYILLHYHIKWSPREEELLAKTQDHVFELAYKALNRMGMIQGTIIKCH